MLKISFDNIYKHKLSENHRFPMIKYELIPEQLIREGTCTDENFFSPSIISEIDVLKVHTNEYYQNLINQNISKKEVRAIGFLCLKNLLKRKKNYARNKRMLNLCIRVRSIHEYCWRYPSRF